MIELKNIRKSYHTGQQSLEVLKGIDLTIKSGEFVSIMGSSGSGKSSLLNILGILDGFDSGQYQLAGTTIDSRLSEKRAAYFRNQYLGFVFQSFNLLPFKNAIENVALPLYYQGVPRKKRNQLAFEQLTKLGLEERAKHYPAELSGGQKQRVALARAIITNPKLILADEPTGALDSQTTREVMQIFKEMHQQGRTIILVTHEDDVAKASERKIVLKDGVITHDSSATLV